MRQSLDNIVQAVKQGLIDPREAIIGIKANIDQKNQRGKTLLPYAIESNELEIVGLLLEYGADVNASDDSGCTPFMSATTAADAFIYQSSSIEKQWIKTLLSSKSIDVATGRVKNCLSCSSSSPSSRSSS
jgi:hypothetical protein